MYINKILSACIKAGQFIDLGSNLIIYWVAYNSINNLKTVGSVRTITNKFSSWLDFLGAPVINTKIKIHSKKSNQSFPWSLIKLSCYTLSLINWFIYRRQKKKQVVVNLTSLALMVGFLCFNTISSLISGNGLRDCFVIDYLNPFC